MRMKAIRIRIPIAVACALLSASALAATATAARATPAAVSGAPLAAHKITVTNPGSQTPNPLSAHVDVAIKATDSDTSAALTYTATGLPAGLAISKTTGVISGTVTTASTGTVKVTATDKVGNVSRPRTTCTTIPVSFTPRDIGPPPTKDAKAYHGYYIHLGAGGYQFVLDIGDEFYFSPTRVALIAERCPTCGVVEIDFNRFVGNPHNNDHELATVNLNAPDHSGDFHLIDVALPVRRVERDGMGDLVIRAASGRPRISGIGVAN